MDKKKLHMIGNAHLDLVWLWRWQEGFQEAKSTLRSALDRTAEFDDFLFTTSTAAVYEWIEHNAPDMFEEIKARVAEGRWEIAGGWWVQPDCLAPSGESFARQGLYGQRYFKEKFGVTATTAYNVDSFGHSGALPQIYRKCGLDSNVFLRPMSHEKGLPSHLFEWEADDGSRVTCFRILYEYLSWDKEVDYHIERCGAQITGDYPQIMCFYGVGNHGGGPTVRNIESIIKAAKKSKDYEIVFSTPGRYFAAVAGQRDRLPVIHGELLHHAAGCYSAHSEIKRLNRECENRLVTAEKLSLAATVKTGLPYPDNFAWAWKKVLLNQFHDTMAGTSIKGAYHDARNWAGAALCVAEENLCHAVQSLSWQIGIAQEEDMFPLVVFNPVCKPLKAPVDFELYGGEDDVFTVIDSSGKNIPCQRLASRVQVNGRCRIGFLAELPPLGYETFRLYRRKGTPKAEHAVKASDCSLENAWLLLEFDPQSGYIKRFYDKRHDFEILSGDGAVPQVIHDDSDTWSHDITRFDALVGQFRARSVKLTEQGPVCATVQVISTYENSKLVQDFTMYADLDRVDVHTKVVWNEMQKVLKLAFPVRTIFNKYCYEGAFGFAEYCNNGEEHPMQNWMDATGVTSGQGGNYGFALLGGGKSSASVDKNTLLLTVLRSPVYAHHTPHVLKPDTEYDVIDQGVQSFTYSMYPHAGQWEHSALETHAQSLSQPPVLNAETFHAGPLPQRDSFVQISAPNVQLSALKRAEDGGGTVLRLYESHKRSTEVVVRLPLLGRELALTFGAGEIKTIYLPDDAEQPPREVLLTEFDPE